MDAQHSVRLSAECREYNLGPMFRFLDYRTLSYFRLGDLASSFTPLASSKDFISLELVYVDLIGR